MHYILTMAVIDGWKNLFNDIGSILFAKVLLLRDSLEELSSLAQLSYQEVTLWVLEEFV